MAEKHLLVCDVCGAERIQGRFAEGDGFIRVTATARRCPHSSATLVRQMQVGELVGDYCSVACLRARLKEKP